MSVNRSSRRAFLTTAVAASASSLISPAQANKIAATRSMRGGSNNYRAGAPIVERIGGGGFWMTGTVRRAGDGMPLAGRLEMPQIVPAFGQAHGHLAYDSDDFETVFLRPVMKSSKDKTLAAHFVLKPV